jgi:hypothetical protein
MHGLFRQGSLSKRYESWVSDHIGFIADPESNPDPEIYLNTDLDPDLDYPQRGFAIMLKVKF